MVVFTLHIVIAKEGEFAYEGANRKSFAPFVEQRIFLYLKDVGQSIQYSG